MLCELYGFDLAHLKMHLSIPFFAAACSLSLVAATETTLESNKTATLHAASAIDTLLEWYDPDTGLWRSTGWWNSANILNVLANFNLFESFLNKTIRNVFNTTFVQAPLHNPTVVKTRTLNFIDSYTTWPATLSPTAVVLTTPYSFVNYFYDDEGWWALAWLKVYEITKEQRYMHAAVDLFKDMIGGYTATCGGIWWDKGHQHNTAIANVLFFAVAARLAIQAPEVEDYSRWAWRQWNWFQHSGMLREDYSISDGLDLQTCEAEHGVIWTYTHGVIIGALIDLDALSSNSTSLYTAWRIARKAIAYFTDHNGILHEPCEPNCGADAPQFKGVLLRNLMRLQKVVPDPIFKHFFDTNAFAIWTLDRDDIGKLGLVWSGPYVTATASTHSSACDALVAAAAAAAHKDKGTIGPMSTEASQLERQYQMIVSDRRSRTRRVSSVTDIVPIVAHGSTKIKHHAKIQHLTD